MEAPTSERSGHGQLPGEHAERRRAVAIDAAGFDHLGDHAMTGRLSFIAERLLPLAALAPPSGRTALGSGVAALVAAGHRGLTGAALRSGVLRHRIVL